MVVMATRKAESAAPGAPWDHWLLLGSLTLLALLIRLPYWQVIPAANDEVNQTIFALDIAQGRTLPLVGNDAYAGPAFFYLLAALLRMGIREPVLGRAVVLVSGTLTVPITTVWVAHLAYDAAPPGFRGKPETGGTDRSRTGSPLRKEVVHGVSDRVAGRLGSVCPPLLVLR